jgi:hypothetical protein
MASEMTASKMITVVGSTTLPTDWARAASDWAIATIAATAMAAFHKIATAQRSDCDTKEN